MKILSTVFIVYLIWCFIVLVHELFHYITAKLFHFNNVKLILGEEFYSINFSKIRISPLLLSGCVEYDYDLTIKNKHIVIFYLAGSFGNLLLIIISLFVKSIFSYWYILLILNIVSIVLNLFPKKNLENDFGKITKLVHKNIE